MCPGSYFSEQLVLVCFGYFTFYSLISFHFIQLSSFPNNSRMQWLLYMFHLSLLIFMFHSLLPLFVMVYISASVHIVTVSLFCVCFIFTHVIMSPLHPIQLHLIVYNLFTLACLKILLNITFT